MISHLLKKRAIRQGSIVLLDQGALSIANFITGVLVARSSSKAEYGIYVLGWSIVMIIHTIHKGFTSLPFTIYAPRLEARGQASYFGSMLVHTLLMCALITGVMFVIYYLVGTPKLEDRTIIYAIIPSLCLLITLYLFREFSRSVLLAKLLVTESLIPNLTATLIQVAIVFLFFMNSWLTPNSALIILAATNGLAAIAMLYTQRKAWIVMPINLWRDFVKSSKIGRWELANGLTYVAGYQLYPWLILPLLGPDDVAAFGACLAIANLPAPFLRGASAYILPRMSHGYKSGKLRSLKRLLRHSTLIMFLPFGLWLVLGTVFGEHLTVFVYSEKYSGYAALLFWLLLRSAIESVATPLTNALQILEKIHVTTISGVMGAIITFTMGPLAIARLGVAGAGITSAFAALVMTIYRWIAIRKYFHAHANQLHGL
jgi:O-antigen/teichoic acid export membrane protein